MGNRRLLFLGFVALLLAGLYYWDNGQDDDGIVRALAPGNNPPPTQNRQTEQSEAQVQSALTGNPLASLNLQKMTATRNRPLFTESRKAPAPPPAIPQPAKQEAPPPGDQQAEAPLMQEQEQENVPGPFVLMGVLLGEAESIALLRHKATGEILRLRRGEVFDGWSLAEVGPDRVLLQKDDREERLILYDKENSD